MSALLEVIDVSVHHGQLEAVHSISLTVDAGQIVAIIGANGAGKSTLLRTIAGLHSPTSGTISLDGTDVTPVPAHARVAAGIALVPEGRHMFGSLSVEENLLAGAYSRRAGQWTIEKVIELFPWIGQRRRQRAWQLSGGEQQAVAVGRALMSNPRLLLLDELSLGLSPIALRRIYGVLPDLVASGLGVLLVEQDVAQALSVADRVHCLLEGRQVLKGAPDELALVDIEAAYFGSRATAAGAGTS
jgi:branched-chain amino acid transport system ATP-binding protein